MIQDFGPKDLDDSYVGLRANLATPSMWGSPGGSRHRWRMQDLKVTGSVPTTTGTKTVVPLNDGARLHEVVATPRTAVRPNYCVTSYRPPTGGQGTEAARPLAPWRTPWLGDPRSLE